MRSTMKSVTSVTEGSGFTGNIEREREREREREGGIERGRERQGGREPPWCKCHECV